MSCKRLDAELQPYKIFDSETILNEKFYNYIDETKLYDIEDETENTYYTITEQKPSKSYWVSYCVSYRPLWLSERILQRWWRNDSWERTEDWIFNDWLI